MDEVLKKVLSAVSKARLMTICGQFEFIVVERAVKTLPDSYIAW